MKNSKRSHNLLDFSFVVHISMFGFLLNMNSITKCTCENAPEEKTNSDKCIYCVFKPSKCSRYEHFSALTKKSVCQLFPPYMNVAWVLCFEHFHTQEKLSKTLFVCMSTCQRQIKSKPQCAHVLWQHNYQEQTALNKWTAVKNQMAAVYRVSHWINLLPHNKQPPQLCSGVSLQQHEWGSAMKFLSCLEIAVSVI